MFTLFFAGEVFAPKALYSGPNAEFYGKNIGLVLRTSYIRAYARLMVELKHLPNVLGVDPMNEPHPGYIGLPSLLCFNETTDLHLGYMPNALGSMALAAGVPTSVPYFSRSWPHPSKITRTDVLNEDHVTAWLPGAPDIWQDERVFAISPSGTAELGPKGVSYFLNHPITGARVDFEADFYVPFVRSFHHAVVGAAAGGKAGTWLFVEPVPNLGPPAWTSSRSPAGRGEDDFICYSPHWYDIRALYEKRLSYTVSFDVLSLASGSRNLLAHSYFGRPGLTKNYADNFRRFWNHLKTFRGGAATPTPILIGETGVPWDMNLQSAYSTGDIHYQLTMTDAILRAMEQAGALNWTFWNLTLSHSTQGTPQSVHNDTASPFQSGDAWNSEDFSIVSSDPATTELPLRNYTDAGIRPHDRGAPLERAQHFGDLYRGLRCAPAFLRPYPFATAGELLKSEFSLDICRFELEYRLLRTAAGPPAERTTEIFVPAYHFWGRRVLARFWVRTREKGVRAEEVLLKWDLLEGDAVAAIRWRWECGSQSLKLVHAPGLPDGAIVGVALEAQRERGADGWAQFLRGCVI